MYWLISANSKIYDHASSFAHHGFIDWHQGNIKYNIGDIVYIYSTTPVCRIRYKCVVTEINKKFSSIRDDKEYWLNIEVYEKISNGKFFNLRLIEEVDSEKLSLTALIENGLKAAPQGPVKLNKNLEDYINTVFRIGNDEFFPETLNTEEEIYEGIKKQVFVNKYERSSVARAKCIEANGGYKCKVCSFDFKATYGEIGKDFIHVHHIKPIHTIGKSYQINYATDLIPVCPNCHAMLHRTIDGKIYSIEELRSIVKNNKGTFF